MTRRLERKGRKIIRRNGPETRERILNAALREFTQNSLVHRLLRGDKRFRSNASAMP